MTRRTQGLGWRPQLPDHRDLMFAASPEVAAALPPTVDLRHSGFMPPVYDQGQLGSCTGNGIAAAIQFERARQKLPHAERVPSRLMIYYDERVMENTVGSDAGAEIRDGIKSVAQTGTCFEDGPDGWPYDISKFTHKPPPACYAAAIKDRAVQYLAVTQQSQQVRACLAAGFPIVFGFTCYSEIDSDVVAKTGRVPMPRSGEAPVGGHCVLLAGYDDPNRTFLFRNSWGPGWALHGYGLFPYEYVLRSDLASDFWTVRLVG